jgi:exosome complex component RRP42
MIATDELKKDLVIGSLKEGKRIDGRGFEDYRPIRIEKGVISSAEASARVYLGNTQVLVGVKVDLAIPFKDRQDEGTLTVSADLLPLASPTFEVGPPRADAIELARVVDRGIRSSEAIDLKSLWIEEGKVWGVYVDTYVLNHDGNLIDAAGLAATAALTGLKIPKYEDEKAVRDKDSYKPFKLGALPTYTTFGKIGNQIILDANYAEEVAMDARLTIATVEDSVCAIQKAGKGSFTREELMTAIDASFRKGQELINYL